MFKYHWRLEQILLYDHTVYKIYHAECDRFDLKHPILVCMPNIFSLTQRMIYCILSFFCKEGIVAEL